MMMRMPARPEKQKAKRTPQRICLACRQAKPKQELIRLVKTPAGKIEIDVTGKSDGRGAYLCKNPACWEKIVRSNALEHAFRSIMRREDREELTARGQAMLKELDIGECE